MRNLTALRNQIAIASFLITISTTGCIAYQKVNADLLEQSRGKTFKLGIVKAAGDKKVFRSAAGINHESFIASVDEMINDVVGVSLFPAHTESESYAYFRYIIKAVDAIPVTEICSILSSQYSIIIDANVDKTVRVREEQRVGTQYVQIGRPQDNKWEFRDVTIASLNAHYGNPSSTKELPDVVYVTYSFEGQGPFSFNYDIVIISSGKVMVTLHGIVGTKFGADLESYVYYAGRIGEALEKDLSEASKRGQSKTVERTNPVGLEL